MQADYILFPRSLHPRGEDNQQIHVRQTMIDPMQKHAVREEDGEICGGMGAGGIGLLFR